MPEIRRSPSRRRVDAVDRALEAVYGSPEQRSPDDPLDTLVLTILSQNTNDLNRDRAYASLREEFPEWRDVLAAPTSKVEAAIRVGGLSRQKSLRIRELLRWTSKRFGALDLEALRDMETDEIRTLMEPLKGVGPKTLSILLLFSLGREAFPLDTHCLRILKRLAVLPEGITATEAHRVMDGLVRPGRSMPLHLNLIRFGRERCHARGPECPGCPLKRLCIFEGKTSKRSSGGHGTA